MILDFWCTPGSLVRDLAALDRREMLPWDVWGAMKRADEGLDLPLLDRVAQLSRQPDRDFAGIRTLYRNPKLAVLHTVFNAVRKRPEAV